MPACHVCSKELANNKGLSYHSSIVHGIKFADYVLKFELHDVWPLCGCGCGGKVRFLGGRFMQYMNHHQPSYARTEENNRKTGDVQRGKKLAPEHKENIRQTMKQNFVDDPAHVMKMANAIRGKKWTEEHREKMGATRSARLASGEIVINKDAISKTITQKYIDGEFDFDHGHHTSPKSPYRCYYRSSWELRHMKAMDADPEIVKYINEPFSIDYEWDGSRRRYIPDFVVGYSDGHQELHEIGVKKLKDMPRNQAKLAAAREFCNARDWTFRLISFED